MMAIVITALAFVVPAHADDMMFDMVPADRPVPQVTAPVAQLPPTPIRTTTTTTTIRRTTTYITSSFMPAPIVLSPAEVDALLRKNASAHDD